MGDCFEFYYEKSYSVGQIIQQHTLTVSVEKRNKKKITWRCFYQLLIIRSHAFGLLSKDIGEKFKDRLEYAMTNIVRMYAHKDVEILKQHMQEKVKNPRTFVLIIADECHRPNHSSAYIDGVC